MSALKEDSPLLQQQSVRGFKALFAANDLTCDMFNQFTGVTTMKQMLDQLIGLYMSALKEDSPLLQQQSVQEFKALFAANDLMACDNMLGLQIRVCIRKLFFYFSFKTYVVGTQNNRLNETMLLSTQNTCLN